MKLKTLRWLEAGAIVRGEVLIVCINVELNDLENYI
jgi:hypothetical protein